MTGSSRSFCDLFRRWISPTNNVLRLPRPMWRGLFGRSLNVRTFFRDRRKRDEFTMDSVGDQACQRGLAHPTMAPQDHRVRPAGSENRVERLSRPKQVPLSDYLVDGPWTRSFSVWKARGEWLFHDRRR